MKLFTSKKQSPKTFLNLSSFAKEFDVSSVAEGGNTSGGNNVPLSGIPTGNTSYSTTTQTVPATPKY